MPRFEWEETDQTVNGHVIEQKVRYRRNPGADYGGNHYTRDAELEEYRCQNCDRAAEKRFHFAEEMPPCELVPEEREDG